MQIPIIDISVLPQGTFQSTYADLLPLNVVIWVRAPGDKKRAMPSPCPLCGNRG